MTIACVARVLTAQDWLVLYPRRRGAWPGVGVGGPILYDPEERTVAAADPHNDRKLTALRGWLEEGDLLSYRPGARAVVRVTVGAKCWFVKIARRGRLTSTLAAERIVAGAVGGHGVVTAAAVVHGGAVYPAAPGASLHDRLRTGAAPGELAAVGEAVAQLHKAPVPVALSDVSTYQLEEWVQWALGHDPDCPDWLPKRAVEIAGSVQVAQEDPVLSHGDLHDKNIFVDPRGVTFIDMGSAGLSVPSVDLGMLAGHIVLRSVQHGRHWTDGHQAAQTVTDAYWSAGGPASPSATRARTAQTLARLACLYRLRRRWHHITPALVEAAAGVRG